MIHPNTELHFVNKAIGHGVFATVEIPRGTITWVTDQLDQTFTPAEFRRLPMALRQLVRKYSYINATDCYVLSWDHARFVNHSCTPNTRSTGWDFEIAVRDIHPGEEITTDYGAFNLERDLTCFCRSERCRGIIRYTDIDEFAHEWDAELAEPLRLAPSLDQPLRFLMHGSKEAYAAFLNGDLAVSCRALRSQRPLGQA